MVFGQHNITIEMDVEVDIINQDELNKFINKLNENVRLQRLHHKYGIENDITKLCTINIEE